MLGQGNAKAGPVEEDVEVRASAEEKTRVRFKGGEGSFPDLGDAKRRPSILACAEAFPAARIY